MRIKKYTYTESYAGGSGWELRDVELGAINLVVGRNSTGKSRFLNTISNLAQQIRDGGRITKTGGVFHIEFDHENSKYIYELSYTNKSISKECLTINGSVVLERGKGGEGLIRAVQYDEMMQFQAPEGEIAVATRQDKIQHPFLVPINEWADSLYNYKFGTELGRTCLALVNDDDSDFDIDTHDTDSVVMILHTALRTFGDKFKSVLIQDLRDMDFDIEDVLVVTAEGIRANRPVGGDPKAIHVVERGVNIPISQIIMSQGMFRSVSLLTHLHYASFTGKALTIVIDDIGEGLDYERSCSLIKIVMRIAGESNVQLIMSTNDRFVMNSVPLDTWTLLKRHGSSVEAISERSHPQMFKEFEYTGLSNFDFYRGASGGSPE